MISKLIKEKIDEYYLLRNLYSQKVIIKSKDETIVDFEMNSIKTMYNNIPKEVLSLACSEQVRQGNPYDPIMFAIHRYSGKIDGGFDWNRSILGYSFWTHTLGMCDYRTAIELYKQTLR